jgi:hypothetical protein
MLTSVVVEMSMRPTKEKGSKALATILVTLYSIYWKKNIASEP